MADASPTRSIPVGERIASGVILCLLAAIAFVVWWSGRAVSSGVTSAPTGATAAAPPAVAGVQPKPLAGYRLGRIRTYTAANLYEYINGQAERYIQFGFKGLVSAAYESGDKSGLLLMVDLYDMGSRRNAYGIWADGHSAEDEEFPVGNEGYLSGNVAVFWKAGCYVRVQALTDAPAADAVRKAGLEVAGWIEDPIGGLEEFAALPSDGQKSDTRSYQREAAFGLEYMNNLFTAQYEDAAGRYKLFILDAGSAEAAAKVMENHRAFLQKSGEIEAAQLTGEERMIWGREKYIGPTFFIARGRFVAGCIGLADRAPAEKAARDVLSRAEHALPSTAGAGGARPSSAPVRNAAGSDDVEN